MSSDAVKRLIDIVLSSVLLLALAWLFLALSIAVRLTSPGPAFYWSERVGRNTRNFWMPKFRSMPIGTPALATHLWQNKEVRLTPLGGFLRRSSLDEIPQLISVWRGEMSFVGPRPALFNQYDLIELREKAGVNALKPGVTGLAQISGRDELSIAQKVALDAEYLRTRGLVTDLRILWLTLFSVFRREGIAH